MEIKIYEIVILYIAGNTQPPQIPSLFPVHNLG